MSKNFLEEMRGLPEGRRLGAYFLFCLAATVLVTAGAYLNRNSSFPIMSSAVKLAVGIGALVLAGGAARIPLRNRPLLPLLILVSLVAPAVYLAFGLGPVTQSPSAGSLLTVLVSLVLTAFWEECVFRLWGRLLFEEEGRYKARDFLAVAVVFGAMHLVNLLTSAPGTVVLEAVFATLAALFLQTVYTRSGSLLLVILIHGLIDAAQVLPGLWVAAGDRFLEKQSGLALILTALFFALSAAVITRRGELIRRGKPFLKLGRKK